MEIDKIIVGFVGLLGIGFVYWFFLMKKDTEVVVTESVVDIVVDGGYQPSFITIPKGKNTVLRFVRKDSSSCLEEVVLPDFRVKKFLPLNQIVSIELSPKKEGVFNFACGMNMFHGKIKVV